MTLTEIENTARARNGKLMLVVSRPPNGFEFKAIKSMTLCFAFP